MILKSSSLPFMGARGKILKCRNLKPFKTNCYAVEFSIRVRPHLDFMPGLTSTTLSETCTTRMVMSPDSGWFCLLR